MALFGEVLGGGRGVLQLSCHAPLQEENCHSAVNWLLLTALLQSGVMLGIVCR